MEKKEKREFVFYLIVLALTGKWEEKNFFAVYFLVPCQFYNTNVQYFNHVECVKSFTFIILSRAILTSCSDIASKALVASSE